MTSVDPIRLVELIDIVPVSFEITGVEIELAAGVTNSIYEF